MVSTRSRQAKAPAKVSPKSHKVEKKIVNVSKPAKAEPTKKVSKSKPAPKPKDLKPKPKAPPKQPAQVKKLQVSKEKPKPAPAPVKNFSKYPHYTPVQLSTFKKYQEELDKNKLPELKDMCRKNLMKVSGTKAEVIERIADARILGVIPKCPACGGGRPQLDPQTLTYYCSGYLEDVDFINCHKTFPYSSIVRVPWQA